MADRACTIAFCFSGAVRSFTQPRIHESIKAHLITGGLASQGCAWDTFFYLDAEDGGGAGTLFAPAPASERDAADALALFGPRARVVWHQEGAGLVPNNCTDGVPDPISHPQLWKLAACYRMVERQEQVQGWQYTWVVRARPDTGWFEDAPPVQAFTPDRVYVGQPSVWPLNDQFALVPRHLAGTYFTAINSFYVCGHGAGGGGGGGHATRRDSRWWFPDGVGAPEALLAKHLHEHGVRVQPYDWHFVIVRALEGARCDGVVKLQYLTAHLAASFDLTPIESSQFEAMVATWHKKRCADTFPPSSGWDADDYDTYMGFKGADPAANDAMCATLSHALAYPANNRLQNVEVDGGGGHGETGDGRSRGEGEDDVWTWTTLIEDGIIKDGSKVGTTIRAFAINNDLVQILNKAARCLHYQLAAAVVPGCSSNPAFLGALAQPGVADGVAQCDTETGGTLMRDVSLAVWERLLAHHECRPSCSGPEMNDVEARVGALLRTWSSAS